jgi:hypothetical protein
MLANIPWGYLGMGYLGFVFYVLTCLSDASDESFSGLADVFVHRGKTVLAAALAVPVLVLAAQYYNELNVVSAFCAGYLNSSLIRKASENYMARTKVGGGQ